MEQREGKTRRMNKEKKRRKSEYSLGDGGVELDVTAVDELALDLGGVAGLALGLEEEVRGGLTGAHGGLGRRSRGERM